MNIYFDGISGAGLSALAFMCKDLGHNVSGSDMSRTEMVNSLQKHDITVHFPQSSDNISTGIELFIYTAAVKEGSPGFAELVKARELGIQCERREYLINLLVKDYISIGVAGTHGKTTTTSLLTHCLISMGEDPSYLIGGILESTGKNANVGKGKYFTWEADEYSNAFHGVHVNHAIINNIEYDHPDFFKSEEDYYNSFTYFINNNISDGIYYNGNDENIKHAVLPKSQTSVKKQSFGNTADNNYYFNENELTYSDGRMYFPIFIGSEKFDIDTSLLGVHNAFNITAVFGLLINLGFSSAKIIEGIRTFKGSGRRMEKIFENEHVLVYSDYAHHPTAIKTTINGVKSMGLPVVAVFEPHQYSRLTTLLNEFMQAFTEADEVIILPIYTVRESGVPADFSETFTKGINNPNKEYVTGYEDIIEKIKNESSEKKLYLCMSAGPLDEYLRKNL